MHDIRVISLIKLVPVVLAMTCASALAQTPAASSEAPKAVESGSKALACDTLKQSIEEKLNSKGVKNYQLDIVETPDAAAKVVGSCDGGKHKIVYVRESGVKN